MTNREFRRIQRRLAWRAFWIGKRPSDLMERVRAALWRLDIWRPWPPYGQMSLDRWDRMGFRRLGAYTLINDEKVPGVVHFDDVRGVAICFSTTPPRLHPYLDQVETKLIRGRIEVVVP